MSDAIEATILVQYPDETKQSMSPGDFQAFLTKATRINTVTTSIKVTRSIPRDKFEKNEYFFSVTTDVGGAYDVAKVANGDESQIRRALGGAIIERVQKGFDLGRVALKQQQQSDGLTIVNLAEATKIL